MITPPVRYRDFTVNFTIHPVKGDLSMKEDVAAISQSIKNLIYTGRYERFWDPLKGAGIPQTLFENSVGSETARLLESQIRETIRNYEGYRAEVNEVSVVMDQDHNSYVCTIIYTPINSHVRVTLDAIFKRVR